MACKVFLIGDSHARNYLPAVKYAFPEHEVYYLTMGWGCAYLPISRMTKKPSRATVLQVKCEEYVEHVTIYISLETLQQETWCLLGKN